MSQLIKMDSSYANWITEVSSRFRSMQIKAATKVNSEMLRFYWSLGRDISAMQAENRYGSDFWENLSVDLEEALPQQKSFSPSNLRYMKRFYELYAEICPQVGGELNSTLICPQVGEDLFSIPWGHKEQYEGETKNDRGTNQKFPFHGM